MAIRLNVQLYYDAGWDAWCRDMSELQGFVLSWFRQIHKQGSKRMQGYEDDVQNILRCVSMRLVPQNPNPESGAILSRLRLDFAHYNAQQGVALLGTYLDSETLSALEVGSEEEMYAFVVIRIADDTAYVILPDAKNASWLPDYFHDEGRPLSEETCSRIIALAR